jgi:hypothetical protein
VVKLKQVDFDRIERLVEEGLPRQPKWSDQKAVTVWVCDVMLAAAVDDAEKFFVSTAGRGASPSEILEGLEQVAVEAARQGSFGLLADMLEQRTHPLCKAWNWKVGPEAIELIARRLRGQPVAKRGRPKQTAERRQLNTPVHSAAAELREIECILRQHYPNAKRIRERAISIAATRAGIEHVALANYLKRPRRRRLP